VGKIDRTGAAQEKTHALMSTRRSIHIPFLSRSNFHYEFRQIMLWSLLAGIVEGQFASVVVSKTFNGHASLIAIASATPIAANLFSLLWGMLCVGRPKIRLLMLISGGAALCAGTVWTIPTSHGGAIWFVAQIAAAQVFLAGVVTVRSAVWRSNYPVEARGQITARLQAVRIVIMVATALTAARLCDWNPESFRLVYPAGAMAGGASLWFLNHMRIRGERRTLSALNGSSGKGDFKPRLLEPFSLTALLSPKNALRKMSHVLRTDHRFRQYCIAQMLIGVANHMGTAIMVTIVTRELALGDAYGFWISLVILEALPRLIMLGSLGRWGALFDRIGVLRMRSVNVVCWTASIWFSMLADIATPDDGSSSGWLLLLAMFFLALRAIATGLGQGGGALAWFLGHLHFSQDEDAEVYMGIHVSLTGIRGLVAPLGGMLLWQLIGWPVWLIGLSLSLLAMMLFRRMAVTEPLATIEKSRLDV
jgi:hypothetical protein